MKISICAIIIALCLALCLCCFVACGNEDTDDPSDNVTLDLTKGELLGLRDVYYAGFIDRDDLINAAYYYNGGRGGNEIVIPEDFEPAPKDPEVLDEELEQAILNDWLLLNSSYPVEDVLSYAAIDTYCGKYGDCFIVKVFYDPPIFITDEVGRGSGYVAMSGWEDYSITVAGINFMEYPYCELAVWHNDSFIFQ